MENANVWKKYRDNPPTSPVSFFTRVTVELLDWLLSINTFNRKVQDSAVLGLEQAALSGDWTIIPNGIGISVPVHGTPKLVDGQHRVLAWRRALSKNPDLEIITNMAFGLPPESLLAIDGGVIRSVPTTLGLSGASIRQPRRSTPLTSMCVRLAANASIPVRTGISFLRWYDIFKKDVEWAVENVACKHGLEAGQISGALAFAHRASPDGLTDFAEKLRNGVGLAAGDPALMLRNHLGEIRGAIPRGKDSLSLARKVLNAALASLQQEKLRSLRDTDHGLLFFRSYWDTPKLRELIQPYAPKAFEGRPRGRLRIEQITVPGRAKT